MGILETFIKLNQPNNQPRSITNKKGAIVKGSGGKQAPIVLQRGEVIRGEVIDLRSKEVTVRLQDGRTLSAKLSDASTLYIGQRAEFFVQETTDSIILLKLLANENLSSLTQATIQKALDGAGLPKTEHNIAIVTTLLDQNMPVNKEAIRQFMQLASQHKEASLSTLALLNKHNLPITSTNIKQFEAFRNYEHRLTEQITMLSDSLSEVVNSPSTQTKELQKQLLTMLSQTTTAKEATQTPSPSFLQAITIPIENETAILNNTNLISEHTVPTDTASLPTNSEKESIPVSDTFAKANTSSVTDTMSNSLLQKETVLSTNTITETFPEPFNFKEPTNPSTAPNIVETNVYTTISSFLDKNGCLELSKQLQQLFSSLDMPTKEAYLPFLEKVEQGTLETSHFFSAVSTLLEENPSAIQSLLREETYQTLFSKALTKHFLLSPQDLKAEQAVEQFYERLDRELTMLKQTLDSIQNNPTADSAKQTVSNMQDNVQFMNSLNALFPYVQLPLKFMEQTSHGELYVYTKKRDLAKDSSCITILLHLDMNYLGPLDIHLALTGKSLTAKFYLEEESAKQLTQSQLPVLSEALAKKGYSFTSEVLTREKTPDPVKEFIEADTTPFMKRYTFDIRA